MTLVITNETLIDGHGRDPFVGSLVTSQLTVEEIATAVEEAAA